MAIVTSRTNENGQITFLYDRCNSCGLCVEVCKDFSLKRKIAGRLSVTILCLVVLPAGICPTKAIEVSGREMSVADRIDLSEMKNKAGFEPLKNLLVGRRSIRDFKDKKIGDDLIEKIIEAAVSAPMGLPPSDVHLVVLKGKEKIREFSFVSAPPTPY